MKKILCLLLALVCLLAGCGKNGDTPNVPDNKTDEDQNVPAVNEQPEEPFALNKSEITLVTQGEVWVLYEGNADLTQVVFSSEDETVATFFNGIVTAKNSGTTTVHADYNGQRYSCVVNCNLRFFPEDGVDQNVSPYGTDPEYPVQEPPVGVKTESFFDDALFIGDAVTLKLSYYAASSGALGKAAFLTRGSYGVNHALSDTMLLSYQGRDLKIEEAVQATDAKKVFLMLGLNDVALLGVDKTAENWKSLLDRLKTACPDVKFYIQSITPVWTDAETGTLTNANVDVCNERLEAAAKEAGCGYIDVAAYWKGLDGGFAPMYCSDAFTYPTDEGCAAWIAVLKAYEY